MKLINNLPVVLPIYKNIRDQNRYKENVKQNCDVALLAPSDSMIPFMFRIPKDSPVPTSWKLYHENGSVFNDISNNIGLLKAYNFEDVCYVYFKGEKMTFKFEDFEQDLNVSGNFYFVIEIDGEEYISEIFQMKDDIKTNEFANKYVKIEFWDEVDIDPIRYREGFKQVLFIDSFIHTSETEIKEDNENDGFDNEIPTFQKLTIRQRLSILVPDFLKTAIESIQIHEDVVIYENNKRQGNIDRFKVNSTSEEFGSLFSLDLILETDVLIKSNCVENQPIISEIWI